MSLSDSLMVTFSGLLVVVTGALVVFSCRLWRANQATNSLATKFNEWSKDAIEHRENPSLIPGILFWEGSKREVSFTVVNPGGNAVSLTEICVLPKEFPDKVEWGWNNISPEMPAPTGTERSTRQVFGMSLPAPVLSNGMIKVHREWKDPLGTKLDTLLKERALVQVSLTYERAGWGKQKKKYNLLKHEGSLW